MIYIGVDPGEMTGIASWDGSHWEAWEVPAESVGAMLRDVRTRRLEVRIGCEQFVERRNQRLTNQPAAQRVTGLIMDIDPSARLISPSTAKTMCDDQRLKKLGWFVQTKDGHANDASRVLFALIAITSPREIMRLVPST